MAVSGLHHTIVGSLLITLAIPSVISCRATSPVSITKSAPSKPDEPVSTPKTDANLGVLRWVVATRSDAPAAGGAASWNLDLKTDSEIWCEARCSKFEVVEVADGDTNELGVKKTSVVGNTTPGMLDVKKQVAASGQPTKKLRLLNVGAKGQSVVLEDVVTKDRPNFYAVPMKLSSKAEGEKSVLKGEFGDKTVEVRLEKAVTLPAVVSRSAAPVDVFVMGSLVETTDDHGRRNEVFWAYKVLESAED